MTGKRGCAGSRTLSSHRRTQSGVAARTVRWRLMVKTCCGRATKRVVLRGCQRWLPAGCTGAGAGQSLTAVEAAKNHDAHHQGAGLTASLHRRKTRCLDAMSSSATKSPRRKASCWRCASWKTSQPTTPSDLTGRVVPLRAGDILAGTLGNRRRCTATREVPSHISLGTVHVPEPGRRAGALHVGQSRARSPFPRRSAGAILSFPELSDRVGRPANIRQGAVPTADDRSRVPVIYVAGTCMNTGKPTLRRNLCVDCPPGFASRRRLQADRRVADARYAANARRRRGGCTGIFRQWPGLDGPV